MEPSVFRFPPVAAPAPKEKNENAQRPTAARDDLLVAHPWLKDYVGVSTGGGGRSSGSGSSGGRQGVPADLDDDVVEQTWRELMEKRRALELTGKPLGSDFVTQVLGGTWTRQHKNKSFDAVVGYARGGAPIAWGKQYNMGVEFSTAYSKYGDERATKLCLEWCRRCQFFYDMYLEADTPLYTYSDADLCSYVEDIDWLNFVLANEEHDAFWNRAMGLRTLVPSKKPKGK